MTWVSTELCGSDAERFSRHLAQNGFTFETSGCYNLVHFEIKVTPKQADELNAWIDEQLGG